MSARYFDTYVFHNLCPILTLPIFTSHLTTSKVQLLDFWNQKGTQAMEGWGVRGGVGAEQNNHFRPSRCLQRAKRACCLRPRGRRSSNMTESPSIVIITRIKRPIPPLRDKWWLVSNFVTAKFPAGRNHDNRPKSRNWHFWKSHKCSCLCIVNQSPFLTHPPLWNYSINSL